MKRNAAYRKLHEILTTRRNALRQALNHDLMGLRRGVGIDIGDSVDNAVDDEFNLVSSQLAQSESQELTQIEEALARIQQRRYGLCDSCGETIPLARLQALPYATRCVNCQRVSEHERVDTQGNIDWPDIRDEQDEESYHPFVERVVDVR